MAGKVEQIEKGQWGRNRTRRKAKSKKYLKKTAHKIERRQGKKLKDDAPKRRQFRGYEL